MLPDPNGLGKRGDRDLTVPDVACLSLEEAALAYADAGWYVLPTDSADIKNPGSIVGGRWQELSSRDPEQIRRWWSANPNCGIALHCGRSGAVVFDLDCDDFATVPGRFVNALRSAEAIQLTRPGGDRGHYVFAMPPGESLSNRAGAFAAYGEVRGKNGVVIAAPTPHPDGGDYHWAKTGPIVAPPPGALRECLSAASTRDVDPLTNTAFEDFLRAHDRNDRPGAMSVVLDRFGADVAAGVSRHYAMVKALGFGYRDAIAGYYPARRLTDALGESFHAAYNKTLPGRRARPESDEFMAAARYVAAEEGDADPDELRARKDGFADVENFKLAQRALAPGGRWHPDTLDETLRALPVEPANDSGTRYRLVTARELADPVEPMRWLVRGIWPERSAGVLAGDKKSMKTWNLQAIALAVAAGRPLFDKYHVTSPGPVLYLAGEGGRSTFANRHQVIAARYYIEPETLRELPFGAEFGVGALDNSEFTDAVKRHLDELQPKLVILDPLYAYHPSDVEVSNLYARGPMLAKLRMLISDEAALIVGDHFNKSAPDRLDLDNVAQAGMAQWADSWILQKHRDAPNLDDDKYWLQVETGTRRGGGKHLEVDWALDRDKSDPDVIAWTGVDWECRPMEVKSPGSRADDTMTAILQVVADHPFELTETKVLQMVGGNRQKGREAFAALKMNGGIVIKDCAADEGGHKKVRPRVGLGPNAEQLRKKRFRRDDVRPEPNSPDSTDTGDGTGSERVAE
ncbi:MAG: hypothetical protein CK431_07055 [Mycobacterium sp.]|nr:MAG: hypothetical protein CK431_07055 [Mycobacterium sp.]